MAASQRCRHQTFCREENDQVRITVGPGLLNGNLHFPRQFRQTYPGSTAKVFWKVFIVRRISKSRIDSKTDKVFFNVSA